MGTWGPGPFDNDAAAEFLDTLRASPSRVVAKILRQIAGTQAGKYIDVDDGGAGWAACEIVALAFGYGDVAAVDDHILYLVAKLRPREEHRTLALEALRRIADRTNSELAALWHEGTDGGRFDVELEGLRSRLQAASAGPRELAKPKPGDVIALQASTSSAELVVVQVVNSAEVAVFEGTCANERAALDVVRGRPAHRVLTSPSKLLRRGQALGNVPLRKDLKGRKVYAGESGAIERYILMAASARAVREVPYEEARDYDEHRHYDDEAIVAICLGARPVARVRSPDEREAALCARYTEEWAARRQTTTPGPFGDNPLLESWLQWIEEHGIGNAVRRHHNVAIGMQGYGRPREDPERRDYASAGVVALWRGTWPHEMWPAELAGRLPPLPDGNLMSEALAAARTLAGRVLTRDAELRLIWDGAPDKGAALSTFVLSLQKALAE
ncbi:MAG: DUF4259 domain-containing protein [Hyphomicrobiaceae bacterium]